MWKHGISALLTALLFGMPLSAQMGRAPMRFSSSPSSGSAQHSRVPRSHYMSAPLWTDTYLPPYETSPSVIVVQAPPAEHPSAKAEDPKPAAPLLIEWQGDRYVRRTETTAANARATQPDYVVAATQQPMDRHSSAAPLSEPPPAMFVFRDGHREESSDYSIISGVIYARGDYWTSGSWSKQIPLAQLDLPATLKVNRERGVTFRLPTAPNEVITRP
jgi:hypothetical protein